jgi:TolA-binding protein
MMNRSHLAILTLILTVIYLQAFWAVKELTNPVPRLSQQISVLEDQLERQQLRTLVDQAQMENFRQEVAAALPPALKKVAEIGRDYPIRNLAAVTMKGSGVKLQNLAATTMFETGKVLFRKGDFERSNRLMEKLIDRYGYATQIIEAHFLLAEGQYQLGQLESSSTTIDRMMELFPESELTGFALLRLGQIFETRDRYDEAVQIYRTVLRSFPYQSVASQAERSLRDMEP